jgi:hypothetical protein
VIGGVGTKVTEEKNHERDFQRLPLAPEHLDTPDQQTLHGTSVRLFDWQTAD